MRHTPQEIEAALDKLARAIVANKEGHKLLPIYERLEEYLVELKREEDALGRVMKRVKRFKE